MLQGNSGLLRKEFDKLVGWIRAEPLPDVISLPNSLLIALAAPLKAAVGKPVCCTLQGEELFLHGLLPAYRERALAMIREQVPTIDRFIAVSSYCADFMMKLLAVPASRMSVVPLGITLDGYERRINAAAGLSRPDPFTIGYFARIAPEKGLHLLADAYIRFRRRTGSTRVRLAVAGYTAPSARSYLNDVRNMLARAGLADELMYRGEVDRPGKLAFLRELDVLSVPATYDEPKGMFMLEAMASGVPLVQPRRGAFPEVIERTGGGLLVNPDDAEALAEGLYTLWSDGPLRARLADRGFDGVRAHHGIAQSAECLLDVYRRLLAVEPAANMSVA
jgi:glycosyltransferase involved in cell wall biosynthesis